jgi:hypothetical protein
MSSKAKIDPVVGHEWDEDAGTYWDDKAGRYIDALTGKPIKSEEETPRLRALRKSRGGGSNKANELL